MQTVFYKTKTAKPALGSQVFEPSTLKEANPPLAIPMAKKQAGSIFGALSSLSSQVNSATDYFFVACRDILSDKRFIYKFGVLFGLNFIVGLLNILVQMFNWSVPFWSYSFDSQTRELIDTIFVSILPLFTSILLFPVWIYAKGYGFMLADRIRKRLLPVLPEHDNYKEKINLGGVFISVNYTLTMPFAMVAMIPLFLLMASLGNFDTAMLGAVFSGSIVVIILASIAISFISAFLVPCFMYIYLRKGNLAEAFKMGNIWCVIKKSFVLLAILFFASILVGFVLAIVQIFFCIVAPLVNPLIQTLSIILYSSAIGSIYATLDEADIEI